MRTGQRSLIEARGVQVSSFGLEPSEAPSAIPTVLDWPFPQVIPLKNGPLWATRTTLSRLTPVTWAKSLITTKHPVTGLTHGFTGEGLWHSADLPGSFFLFNGESVVFKTGLGRMMGGSDGAEVIYAHTNNAPTTGCAHRGRIIIGGLNDAMFEDTVLGTAVSEWGTEYAPDYLVLNEVGLPTNFVLWSSIGGGDFPLWLMFPATGNDAVTAMQPTVEDLQRAMKQNTWGFMPMPWNGNVLKVLPLRDKVIVYGDNGIAALVLANGTYGMQEIANFGIASRDAATGDENTAHHFVSSDGVLYRLGPDLSLMRLGYESYTSGLLGGDCVLLHSPLDGRVFASSADEGFILASRGERVGLTEGLFSISSVFSYQGILYGVRKPYETQETLLVTAPFDLGIRGLKTINAVTLATQGTGAVQVALDYRYTNSGSWGRTAFQTINNNGIAHIRISALEFRLVIKTAVPTNFYLDDVQFKFQLTDKRNIRGPLSQTAAEDL